MIKSKFPETTRQSIHRQRHSWRAYAFLLIAGGLAGGLVRADPVPAQTQTALISAGEWEIRQVMTGGPGDQQPQLRVVCLTSEELATDPMRAFRPVPPPNRSDMQCSMGDIKLQSGQLSYQTSCALPFGNMKGQWQGTVDEQSFSVIGNARMMGRTIRTEVVGRRLGACNTAS